MYVIFENAGEIDPRLIGTFGVNVKEHDNAVGFFGTGLKYALAILTRTDHQVLIQAGETVHEFARQPANIRGKDFEFVAMDGRELGFTTEIGKTWKLWMAYRELFCNCQDEAGTVYEADALPEPSAGTTRVIVRGNEFLQCRRNHGDYFCMTSPLWADSKIEVHPGPAHGVFYRDVLVGTVGGQVSRFGYNLRTAVDLTEDRTLKYPFLVETTIARGLVRCEAPEVVPDVVTAERGTMEHDLDFNHSQETPSETFVSVVGELARDRVTSVNPTAVKMYENRVRATAEPTPVELSKVERRMLDKATEFCTHMGFHIDQPVQVVESLGPDVLGMARKGRIYIAHRAFMYGTKQLAGTLIEEYLHLRHNMTDCSRQMQNYLLDRLVSTGEELTGEPL